MARSERLNAWESLHCVLNNKPVMITLVAIENSSNSLVAVKSPAKEPRIIPLKNAKGPTQGFLKAIALQKPTKRMTKKWSNPLKGCAIPVIKSKVSLCPGWALERVG